MFTGIVLLQGIVAKKQKVQGQVRFLFQFKKMPRGLSLGESIAVNGVCLTVRKLVPRGFCADAVAETLKATTLGSLEVSSPVNLERSLQFGDRVGGHFVTGHVDGVGTVRAVTRAGKNITMEIEAPQPLQPFLASKGSVAVDGVSLTLQLVRGLRFQVALVPHTLRVTTLRLRKPGDRVNLEADMLVRYSKAAGASKHRGVQLTLASLLKQGF